MPPDDARALWIVGTGRARIAPALAPVPAPGEVRVRALQSGISRGTEALVHAGRVPAGEWQRMACPFQGGAFPFPVKYGYAMVGVIEAGPQARLGQRVFCLHPHQDRFTVPEAAALAIPDDVPTARAVLASQIETALNASWDAAPRIGDRIAVVGGGTIGCLVAWLCARLPATEVTLVEIDPGRAPVAQALGCGFALADSAPRGCDLVFHASGTGAGLATAIDCAGFEAELIELSWYGDTPVTVPLGGAFHSQRLTLRASQVGRVSPGRRARRTRAARLALALAVAADPRLDVLVRDATHFEDLPGALDGILGAPGALTHRVLYGE